MKASKAFRLSSYFKNVSLTGKEKLAPVKNPAKGAGKLAESFLLLCANI